MANKRMFTMKIVDSDAFLEMPLSTQCLYFHLNMRADDDGFIGNPKKIMKIVGASEDDLKLLIAKRFVLCFEDGVIVIKHWRMHNTLSQNRYHETQYVDEKSILKLKENGSYSFENGEEIDDKRLINAKEKYDKKELADKRLANGLQTADADSDSDLDLDLDKDLELDKELDKEKEEDIVVVSKDTTCQTQSVRRIVNKWNELSAYGIKGVDRITSSSQRYGMLIARIKEYGEDKVVSAIEYIKTSNFLQGKNNRGWSITFDWFVKPSNFPKVLEGNYDNRTSSVGYQNKTAEMLQDSYEMMSEWVRKKEMEENGDDN